MKNENLIICHTPLQILLAEEIIKKYRDEDFISVVFFSTDNEKIKYYSERLKKITKRCFSVHLKPKHNFFMKVCWARIKFWRKTFNRVFLASIDSLFVHSILSSIEFKELMTFDDGTANILKTSSYFIYRKSMLVELSRLVLFIRYNTDLVRKNSIKHYTIYDRENIIENLERLELFSINNVDVSNSYLSTGKISILLGQPIYHNDDSNIELFLKIIRDENVDYYFPHPREKYVIPNVSYIDTDLIFEDYVKNIFEQYSEISIYTIFSSAVLQLLNNNKIKIYSVKVNGFEQENQLMKEFGISILELKKDKYD